jgi:hypothetical protein
MPKTYVATWNNIITTFKVPTDVHAYLSDTQDKKSTGHWWVRYNTLHYIDKEGEEKTIDGSLVDYDDLKNPEEVKLTEEAYSDDSEKEDEQKRVNVRKEEVVKTGSKNTDEKMVVSDNDIWFRLTKDDVTSSYLGLTGISEMPEEVWQKFISLKSSDFIGDLLFEHGFDPISNILTEHCGVKSEWRFLVENR